MHTFTHLLSRSRKFILDWSNKGMSSFSRDLKSVEFQINCHENHVHNNSMVNPDSISFFHSHLRELHNIYNSLFKHNNTKWAQRSRLMWINNGDINSSFFHNCAHIIKNKNSIFDIIDANGHVQNDKDKIKSVFLNHYA